MRFRFYTADVFTDRIFGGNQLAVFPNAEGLDSAEMQNIAREFNIAETVFVFPPKDTANTRRLRIFTPESEVPFAGHPTVGSAFVLASVGEIELPSDETRIVFEEGVGPVPVTIRARDGVPHYSELSAAMMPEFGPPPPANDELAELLSLSSSDFDPTREPCAVSCGLPFLCVPLADRAALARARFRADVFDRVLADYWAQLVYIYAFDPERPGSDVRVRMFAPSFGVPEDPATGSAAAAFAGLLAERDPTAEGTLRWVIEQGFEMGRPSIINAEADKQEGRVTAIRVGGSSVMVSEGSFGLGIRE